MLYFLSKVDEKKLRSHPFIEGRKLSPGALLNSSKSYSKKKVFQNMK